MTLTALILLWALSSTAGALQCQTCTNQTCSSTVTVNCSSETMCVTATILAKSSGTTATQIYKACASSSLCPATGNQTFSVDLGVESVLASAMCCNTDNCNSQNLPAPTPQSSNGLQCNACATSKCNTPLHCQGVEDQCFQSMMRDGTNSFPAYGCASANLCAAASSLGSLPFMQMAGTITSGPNCTSRTTTAAPTTTTKAASTTTTAAPTTTTAAPTTTTPTTTTVAPTTTTTAPTTTTAAPTTTIVVDTRTTSAPTLTTAGALQCQTCTNQTCSSTVTVNCSSETMCVTATILATSSGTTATQFYKACASSSLCPATGNQTFSVNLGVQSVLASATCCNTDNCNSQNLPAPTPQSSNGLLCNTCVASQCNTTLQCQGVEDQCFQSMMRDGTNSFPAYGCASANLCAAASSLGSLPFMQMAGTITSGPNCTSRTTTAAPTTTTKAASTTTTAAPTTTTAAPTTTTPTTTTVAPNTTTTAPTTTTAAPTTTIVVDTRTTSAPTSTTAGALQCQTCTNQTCSSTVTVNCSSETMCVTATILATSSGTTATQFYKACASSSLCPATGNQTFSVNLGVQSVLASATCCNTDNCNSQNLPAPTPQSSNGLLCNTCVASQCNTTLQCQGVEDQCFQSMMRDGTNSFPAYGCASANLCAAASSLGSLPFMQMAGTITSGPNCTSRTTTAAPTTTTKAASTTTTAAPTTTTAAPTTTTPTTTTVAPNTTTTAPTTTTAAPTTTIVVDTRTTSAPTSTTAGALQCQTCTNQTCSSTVTVNCSSETMCVTATILATSSGTTATQFYKACASSSLCPATGNQTFSVNLGVQSVLASATCCNTDNCNSQNLPAPTPQSSNGLLCNTCVASQCNTTLQCQGVEDQCFQSTMTNGTNSFPAYGCASANLCAAASSLGSLPFMQMVGTITSGPNCTSCTTTAAPTTTTAAPTTTKAASTTTTAAPTTTTPTTTIAAPTTTTTAKTATTAALTTTTAAPTTTIVVDTRTTSAPTSTTAGALQCQNCTDETCSSTVTVNCSSETMCVTATILATSSGTTATQFYKACASSSLCPATGNQTFSVNLGVQSVLASATCCNTDNCNSQNLTAPTRQSSNGLLCNVCVASQCNTTLQCQGVEDQCFQSTMTNGTNSFPAYGCASANLCAAASSLGSLPFMQMVGTITSGPNCTSCTTTAAPTTTTAAPTTTKAASTTTTAAPTTTTPTTTIAAPTTTTTAKTTTTAALTTTTAAPTTIIVVDTRTTSAPTSTTAGALQCQNCTDETCSSTVTVNCSSETMCVTATILATSSGTTATQIYKACASSSLCPATGNQTFSVNLGVQSVLASATCCNTDNCNSQNLTAPTRQSSNGLLCNVCVASQCNTTLQCQGVEDQCFQSTMTNGTNSFPAYGCASANLCAAASSLGSLPFMQMAGTITSGPNCTSCTTTAAPTTTTAAPTTTKAASTTTTAAPTTTTPTTTIAAPTTTTTAKTTTTAALTTTTAAPTTTIVVDTRTTSAPTSTTAGALQCQNCTDETCSSTVTVNCSSETMCVTATILATSSGTTATQIYKACASSSLCPATGNQTFSVNLGVQSVLASATCCNTDNCNSQNLPGNYKSISVLLKKHSY
ncbi:mucin-5AC-like [Oreochromis aureus]|uniref:mucin-5AC-like n=1 Tax=Oreochromis aureus TaxID=47969 RepID=UPI001953B0EB|nr:mucin-5AC-like [Oreochromis aureus]